MGGCGGRPGYRGHGDSGVGWGEERGALAVRRQEGRTGLVSVRRRHDGLARGGVPDHDRSASRDRGRGDERRDRFGLESGTYSGRLWAKIRLWDLPRSNRWDPAALVSRLPVLPPPRRDLPALAGPRGSARVLRRAG